MTYKNILAFTSIVLLCMGCADNNGYKITGNINETRTQGTYMVVIDTAYKDNEDVFRKAVANNCRIKSHCSVHFWVGKIRWAEGPSRFPLTEAEAESLLMVYNRNTYTGLNRWAVRCKATKLFSEERKCFS